MKEFTCPCCGYLTLDEAPGSYDTCEICGWEDDLWQLRYARRGGGANTVSLIEGQRRYARYGRRDPTGPPLGRAPRASDVRDPDWRPIDEARDAFEDGGPGVGDDALYPADPTSLYYWRSDVIRD